MISILLFLYFTVTIFTYEKFNYIISRYFKQQAYTMNWEELKNHVYYHDGSLRDIYIRNVTQDEWRRWAEYVSSNYPVDFKLGGTHAGNKINFDSVVSYWQDSNQENPSASIRLGAIIVNTFFFDENEIENDITPTEIKTLEDHLRFLEYLRNISILLNRPVELTEESYQDVKEVLMVVDGEKVTFRNR